MIYLGYGVIGGIGLGLGYISPVSTLIKWFPDRPGMATGMAIMGFGGGALIGSPLATNLMHYFRTDFAGRGEDVPGDGRHLFCCDDVRCFYYSGAEQGGNQKAGWLPVSLRLLSRRITLK